MPGIVRRIGVLVDTDSDRELTAFSEIRCEENLDLAFSWDIDGFRLPASVNIEVRTEVLVLI